MHMKNFVGDSSVNVLVPRYINERIFNERNKNAETRRETRRQFNNFRSARARQTATIESLSRERMYGKKFRREKVLREEVWLMFSTLRECERVTFAENFYVISRIYIHPCCKVSRARARRSYLLLRLTVSFRSLVTRTRTRWGRDFTREGEQKKKESRVELRFR